MWRALIVSLALICLVLLGWYAIKKYPGRIEASLATRAQAAVVGKVPGVTVQASQRDLVLSGRVGTADDKARAEKLARELSGVKSVVNQLEVGAAPKAEPKPTTKVEPQPAPEPAPEVVPPDVIEAAEVAPDVVEAAEVGPDAVDVVEAADTAQPETEDVAAGVAPTPAGGALTPAQCKEVIATMIEGQNRIVFQSNTGKLTDEGHQRLAEVWAVLQRCPSAGGTIEAYHDDHGDPDKVKTLTQIRAYNTHRRLIEMGMDEKRFRYVGFGYRNMRYRKPGERLLNQRIEFNITVE